MIHCEVKCNYKNEGGQRVAPTQDVQLETGLVATLWPPEPRAPFKVCILLMNRYKLNSDHLLIQLFLIIK